MIIERGKAGNGFPAHSEGGDAVLDPLFGVWGDLKDGAAQRLKRAAFRLADALDVSVNFLCRHPNESTNCDSMKRLAPRAALVGLVAGFRVRV